MKTCFRFVTFAMLAILITHASVAQQTTPTIDEAMTQLRSYTFGDSPLALRTIEESVYRAAGTSDDDQVDAFERRFIDLLNDTASTVDAKRFACRQLALIGSDRAVGALTLLLRDGQLGHMASFALEGIATAEARAALLQHHVEGLVVRALRGVERARAAIESLREPDVDGMLVELARGSNPEAKALVASILGWRGAVDQRPFLDRLTSEGQPGDVRSAAFRAIARLYDWRETPDRSVLLADALRAAESPEAKRAVLDAIHEFNERSLFPLVRKMMQADQTHAAVDAAWVVVYLAPGFATDDASSAKAALHDVMNLFDDEEQLRAAAGDAIASIEANEDFIADWSVTGPFLASAAEGEGVFDYAWWPERNLDRGRWTDVPANAFRSPGVVNLNAIFGGADRAAYALATIDSDSTTPARLEIGSDDGVKVWVNGELVHANDAARGLTLNEDVVPVTLRRGENTIVVKVTQGSGDWQFAVRVRDVNGLHLDAVDLD